MLNKLIEEKVKRCERNIEDIAMVFARHTHKEPHRYCFIFYNCKYAGENITLNNEGKARYCEKQKHIYHSWQEDHNLIFDRLWMNCQ